MRIWIDALRNDTDGQCVGELVDHRGCHCAIGVGIKASGNTPTSFRPQYDQIVAFSGWLGRADDWTSLLFVRVDGVRRSVMELNDRFGWTFKLIADALEQEYLTPAT